MLLGQNISTMKLCGMLLVQKSVKLIYDRKTREHETGSWKTWSHQWTRGSKDVLFCSDGGATVL